MPLRDHFRPPLSEKRSWDGLHGQWPAMIVMGLNRSLPERYVAEPQVHLGSSVEVDVATLDAGWGDLGPAGERRHVASMTAWAPPEPTLAVETALAVGDEYEVRVFDTRSGRRLVAAVELVSPANKDRPEHRRAFVTKCSALLQERVCVVIVDVVTNRTSNLYGELMGSLGRVDPALEGVESPLYAVACRWGRDVEVPLLETWMNTLAIGRPLPSLPLWLADDLAVRLDLEESYEETCRVLRITADMRGG